MNFDFYCNEFWNSIGNSNTFRLTRCLQIGLAILPNLIFYILIPFEIRSIINSKNNQIKLNLYNSIRYLITIFIILSNLILLFIYINESIFSLIDQKSPDTIIVSSLNIFTFLTLAIIYHYHRLKGIITSGVLFVSILFFTITNCILFIDTILNSSSTYQDYERSNILTTFLCCFSLFALSFMSDDAVDAGIKIKKNNNEPNKSPREYSSFISKLTFYWFTDIIKLINKRDIQSEDIFELPDDIKVKTVTKRFKNLYYDEIDNIRKKNEKLETKKQLKFNWISTLKLIWKSSRNQILLFLFLDILEVILVFPKPILLDLLITFISDSNSPDIYGYLIVIGFILNLFSRVVLLNHYHMIATSVRFNLKTSMSYLIYHKILKLGNNARKNKTVGEIINIFQSDSSKYSSFVNYSVCIITCPIQFAIGFYLLYLKLGKASFIGLIFIIVMAIFQHYFQEYKRKFYKQETAINDERVKLINETFTNIKIIKLQGFENAFHEKITDIRDQQSKIDSKVLNLQTIFDLIFYSLSPIIRFLITIGVYIYFIDENITPQQAFFVSTIYGAINYPIRGFFSFLNQLLKAKVSLERLASFLNEESVDYITRNNDKKIAIKIQNKANFIWETRKIENDDEKSSDDLKINDNNSDTSTEKNQFQLKDIELEIRKGEFTAVIGQIGSGKSSLISAILGEMQLVENVSGVKGKVNISDDQSISYVSQIPWIQNASFKDNILFGRPFDKAKYENVIRSCALITDLEQFEAGDKTEIGEKGINLSGGQKQRVSIARACYASLLSDNENQIILLDDPLSAVDAHVGKHLCEKVLNSKTGILKNSTRILVTNQINQLGDLNLDKIILLKDGEIKLNCLYSELIKMNKEGKLDEYNLKLQPSKHMGDIEKDVGKDEDQNSKCNEVKLSNKKLIDEEEIKKGGIDIKNYFAFFHYFGYVNAIAILIFAVLENYSRYNAQTYLADWTSSNLKNNLSNTTKIIDKKDHLLIYASVSLFEPIFNALTNIFITFGIVNCIIKFHRTLLYRILRSPMRFFDQTPIGRIISRFTEDISQVDNVLAYSVKDLTTYLIELITAITILISKQKETLVFYIFIFYIYFNILNKYNDYSRKVKRFTSTKSSSVYSYLNESLNGLSTIRCMNKIDEFEDYMKSKFENNNRSSYFKNCGSCWMKSSLNLVSNMVIMIVVTNLILNKKNVSAGDVGLIIYYCMDLTSLFMLILRDIEQLESNAVSIERINQFCEIEQEDDWIKENNRTSVDWPSNGEIEFINYSVKYREDTSLVLKNLNFKVNDKEKIGVVGRTGAGKSTITLALLRILEPAEGKILIDNLDISKIGLHDLRSKLSIIPQDPVLFTGTIKFNLDPFNKYSNEEINQSLEHAHLKEFVDSLEDGMNYKISEGGENISVGQRQLICLARALLKKSKILILDEATASVDFVTDDLVQKTIRFEFKNCTIITIAHRLNTVLDSSRILLIDNGQLKEYDKPNRLLNNKKSLFYEMALKANLI